jgi:hypothetical protein
VDEVDLKADEERDHDRHKDDHDRDRLHEHAGDEKRDVQDQEHYEGDRGRSEVT